MSFFVYREPVPERVLPTADESVVVANGAVPMNAFQFIGAGIRHDSGTPGPRLKIRVSGVQFPPYYRKVRGRETQRDSGGGDAGVEVILTARPVARLLAECPPPRVFLRRRHVRSPVVHAPRGACRARTTVVRWG